jgi:pyruvate kinase
MERCAKIVATMGPSSKDEATIEALLKAGVDVARLNFSHGTHADHADMIRKLRSIAAKLGRSICILQDLQGPKIRTGEIDGAGVMLRPGQQLILTSQPVPGSERIVSVDYADLPKAVQPEGRILLDDGQLELKVVSINDDQVETKVVVGGLLKAHKGVNLPGAKLNIPCLTEKDISDLAFGLEQDVDVIALSFVRTSSDIQHLREEITRLEPDRARIPIIAKLERPEALDNLVEILKECDGVMVARGDLGVEMSPESVPLAQKRIIEYANLAGKVVITATQMLDSMINNPRPTRAEASDVANAILDGSDALMLSGETAAGKYPIKAVEMMVAIICQTEAHGGEWCAWDGASRQGLAEDDTFFLTRAAHELAEDRNVAAIAIFTYSGRSALLMSKTRPKVPILGFTSRQHTFYLMSLYWGVKPHMVPHVDTVKAMLQSVETAMISSTVVEKGQQVVLVCGFPVNKIRATNMAMLHTVGDPL